MADRDRCPGELFQVLDHLFEAFDRLFSGQVLTLVDRSPLVEIQFCILDDPIVNDHSADHLDIDELTAEQPGNLLLFLRESKGDESADPPIGLGDQAYAASRTEFIRGDQAAQLVGKG